MAADPTPSGRSPAALLGRLKAWLGEAGTPRRVLVRNSLWESSNFLAASVVTFFLSPFIVHRLGDSLYGVWEMVISLTGFLGFADLGVRPAAVHFIARHDARQDQAALNRFVNSSLVAFTAAGVLVLLVAIPLRLPPPAPLGSGGRVRGPGHGGRPHRRGGFALELPFNAFSAVLVGKQRYDLLRRHQPGHAGRARRAHRPRALTGTGARRARPRRRRDRPGDDARLHDRGVSAGAGAALRAPTGEPLVDQEAAPVRRLGDGRDRGPAGHLGHRLRW